MSKTVKIKAYRNYNLAVVFYGVTVTIKVIQLNSAFSYLISQLPKGHVQSKHSWRKKQNNTIKEIKNKDIYIIYKTTKIINFNHTYHYAAREKI
jgi:hypothetical protein